MPRLEPYGEQLVYQILTEENRNHLVAEMLDLVLVEDLREMLGRQSVEWLLGCLNAARLTTNMLQQSLGIDLEKAAEITMRSDPDSVEAKAAYCYAHSRAVAYCCALQLVLKGYCAVGDRKEN